MQLIPESWWEVVRLVNLVLGVWLTFVCTLRLVRDWDRWTRREKLTRVHLTGYLLVLSYATIEQLANGAEPGFRVVLILAVHTSFALALWRSRNDLVVDRTTRV